MMAHMVRAIREIVTVGPDGAIRLQSPEIHHGVRAEVIVLLDPGQNTTTPSSDPLAALDTLQKSLSLDSARAQQWADRSADERKASSRL
jgi:hypothetical protein